jgi:hypothetical protein
MTTKQRRAATTALARLDRIAALASETYDGYRAAYGEYAMGRDDGTIMIVARAADDANKAARNFRARIESSVIA